MAAHAGGSVRWEIEALLLHAVILREQKTYPEALSCLEKALTLAEEEGFARIFLNEGDPILDLLQQSRQNGNRYAAKLMSFIDKNEPVVQNAPSTHPTAASEPVSHTGFIQERLSKREIEVLRLIADGCANKEISSLLFISIGTVKRHVIHILRKLDAANRTQAVVMAREQKII
jgi:LuxR family maltose regulon positive regulatory protein